MWVVAACFCLLITPAYGVLRFVDTINNVQFPENVDKTYIIGTLRAVDTETGTSDGIMYGFNNNQDNTNLEETYSFFRINPNTGAVTMADVTLDYEIQKEKKQISYTLNLMAKKGDIFTRQVSVINLLNLNDNSPKFENGGGKLFWPENTDLSNGSRVLFGNITVNDPDQIIESANNYIQVRIAGCTYKDNPSRDCAGRFQLIHRIYSTDRFVGDLMLIKSLDYEDESLIIIRLEATDGKNVGNGDFAVTIENRQDIPARWISLPPNVKTYEESPLNVSVEAEDGDGLGREVFYSLIPGQTNQGVPIDNVFQIDSFTGVITNKIRLDLEDEVNFRNYETNIVRQNWKLSLKACEIESRNPIVVTDQCTQTGNIIIQVMDINDNAPLHLSQPAIYNYRVFENEPNGRVFVDPRIRIFDRDTPKFAKFNTELIDPSDEFLVRGRETDPVIGIQNTTLLDMDTLPRTYTLRLRTYDIDTPSLSSTSIVNIELMDRNDNPPIFAGLPYTASVRENAMVGESIITVQAFDKDFDVQHHGNESIKYSLTGAYSELFRMDEDTGEVTVWNCESAASHGVHPCIDFDVEPRTYNLRVQAADNQSGIVALFDYADLTIQVVGVNDNRPAVPDYNRTIREDRTTFLPDLRVEGTDIDDFGGASSLSYSIQAQSPGNIWAIDPITGSISVQKPDGSGVKFNEGDQFGKFELDVAVTDGRYTTTCKVYIRVLDQNDNAPRFLQGQYEIAIDETVGGDYSVLQLDAIDADDPTTLNGMLEYSIIDGDPGGLFRIDNNAVDNKPVLYTTENAVFSYTNQKVYYLTARVSDRGTPQLSGFANITVNILNQNTEDPKVIPFLQQFIIYENWSKGRIIGTVQAEDPDPDAQLIFDFVDPRYAYTKQGTVTLNSNYPFYDHFAIDNRTGVITVNTDRLSSSQTRFVNFRVRVTDITPAIKQFGFGTITIQVLPYNTEPPRFLDFKTPVNISEELPRRSLVVALIARDDNGIRGYKIVSQTHDYFLVTPNTGSVNIKNTVDYDDARRTNESYVVVEVEDTGTPTLTTTGTIQVIFYNINDNIPIFVNVQNPTLEQSLYFGDIQENSGNGTYVTTVKALDADRPGNGFDVIRYSMNDTRFMVDPINGTVWVRLLGDQVLDREVNSQIQVLVYANDNPGDPTNQNRQVAMINIQLIDENDNPPIFSDTEYEVTIYETIRTDTTILQVFTTDLDIGNFAEAVYTKLMKTDLNGDVQDFFGVRRESGQIYVKKSLLRQARTEPYVFWVEAEDNLGNGLKSEVKVSVYVKMAVNVPPRWIFPPIANMTIKVLESQYRGMLVYDAKAEDDDTGQNGKIDYFFIYEGQTTDRTPEFRINRVTGMIRAQVIFDRERVPRYVLLLKAVDNGTTPLEATRFLTIQIIDVNDNLPVFPVDEVEFRVQENEAIDYQIGSILATDDDLEPKIYYEIISGNELGVFKLGRESGILSLAKKLDSESQSVYYLDVRARNEEPEYTVIQNRRRRAIDPSIITIKVLVGDINDIAPVFLEKEYYGCVSTRSPYEKQILTVQARDEDAVGSGIVRYRLVSGNTANGKDLFGIHEKLGVLTNKVLMRDYANQIFDLKVNARDAENIAEAESANASVKVFVTIPGKEVKLLITQNTGEVRLYQTQIQSIIEEANDLDYLCINEIGDHVTQTTGNVATLWSDVYVSGVRRNPATGKLEIISGVELRNIISREISSRKQDFDLLYIKEVELASSSDEIRLRDKAVLIILIIIAVLIFLVIIFCIVAFMCIRAAKQQKKQILVHKTHASTVPIMVAQEPVPEPVIYDNRQYVQEVERRPEPEPVFVSTVQETKTVEHPPVYIQYATVQKRGDSPQPQDFGDEDGEEYVVEVQADENAAPDVYEPEEYRIVAEVE